MSERKSAIITKDKLGIFVETREVKDGTSFTLVRIQKAKPFGDGMDDILLSLDELRTILAKAEELK